MHYLQRFKVGFFKYFPKVKILSSLLASALIGAWEFSTLPFKKTTTDVPTNRPADGPTTQQTNQITCQ